jgi:DnaJ-class molecular chaperone
MTVHMMTGNERVENHYQLFGVPVDAPTDTIRRAWLIRIRKSHPDRHVGSTPDVQVAMAYRSAELNAAWCVLRDDRQRLDYDLDHGLRTARCSGCGGEGFLRRTDQGVVSACPRCWHNASGQA